MWLDPLARATLSPVGYRIEDRCDARSTLATIAAATATHVSSAATIRIAIEDVPLGARIATKNPKPWEYDESFPEPDRQTWEKVSLTVRRTDGVVVDMELIRPREWIQGGGLAVGSVLPLSIEELQVVGLATVRQIEACPEIADGAGRVVTGRFMTRQVDRLVRVEVGAIDGTTEAMEGTAIHPFWSLDLNDWVAMGELEPGERLSSPQGEARVLSQTIVNRVAPVYNVEVHGEHVYQVGDLALLVHNAYAPVKGPNLPILNPHFTPVSQFIGEQATVAAHLPPGKYTALIVDGQVYVAKMHNVAWELAGRKGVTQFYGFAEIDALGRVVRLFK